MSAAARSAAQAFAAHAPQYTAQRRRLVPCFDGFYGSVVRVLRLVAQDGHAPRRVLDLGAGTGLLSAHLLDAFPEARVELLDAAEPMLDEARMTLGDRVDGVHVADMSGPLPAGPFDAVVSALAIHHLTDADKQGLFSRIHQALAPGGAFVNAEQVAGATPQLTERYTEGWIEDCRAAGATEAEIQGGLDRGAFDLCVDVETQLTWLREAGFAVADCFFKQWRFAVYAGFKAA